MVNILINSNTSIYLHFYNSRQYVKIFFFFGFIPVKAYYPYIVCIFVLYSIISIIIAIYYIIHSSIY